MILAGSERADFPQQTERLLLSVAANQAFYWIAGGMAPKRNRGVLRANSITASRNEQQNLPQPTKNYERKIVDRKHAEEDRRTSEEKHRVDY